MGRMWKGFGHGSGCFILTHLHIMLVIVHAWVDIYHIIYTCMHTYKKHTWATLFIVLSLAIGGQKQAQRVSKLIQACKHKLTKLLAQYSELGHSNGEGRQHTIEEVCDLQSTFWICSDHTYSANADPTTAISPATQRRLLELHHFEARAREKNNFLLQSQSEELMSTARN